MKTHHCEDCRFFSRVHAAGLCRRTMRRVRFYVPRSETDEDFGFKARCEEFERAGEVDAVSEAGVFGVE